MYIGKSFIKHCYLGPQDFGTLFPLSIHMCHGNTERRVELVYIIIITATYNLITLSQEA